MSRLLALAFLLLVASVQAHQIAEMTLRIEADGEHFQAVIEADAAYMLPEYRGDEDVAAQDLAWLRELSPAEWQRIREETVIYLQETLTIRSETGPIDWKVSFPDFDQDPPTFVAEGIAEMPPMISVRLVGRFTDETLGIEWKEPFGVVLIVQTNSETIPIVSGFAEPILHRKAGREIQSATPTLAGWVRLGFRHIIPDGLDHILFVLGIFLLRPQWKTLLTQTLIFTLAHSLTLGLAAVGWVQLPDLWVELAIAGSITWIGFENLWLKKAAYGRYVLIAVFGLIHGLGFARMLTPFLPANRPDSLLLGIGGFNVGVELGQILVLALAYALCGWMKESGFSKIRVTGSIMIGLAGLAMIAARATDGDGSIEPTSQAIPPAQWLRP